MFSNPNLYHQQSRLAFAMGIFEALYYYDDSYDNIELFEMFTDTIYNILPSKDFESILIKMCDEVKDGDDTLKKYEELVDILKEKGLV